MVKNTTAKHSGMNRRAFLGATTTLAAAGTVAHGQQTQEQLRPDQKELLEKQIRNKAARAIKRSAKPNGLNVIVLVSDTFRVDHIEAYGFDRAKTPNLNDLAKQSVVFRAAFADGLPTIPCRRCYHTGKSVIPGAAWIPLPAGDVTLAQILSAHGVWTGLVCDVYHYFKPDMNLHVGFDTWEWIRGQETDHYLGGPREKFQPKNHMPPELWNPTYDRNMRIYMMNTQYWKTDDDYFAAQTINRALQWLERNATNSPFMLWIEIFDPHEPWDAPPRFQKMYRDDYGFERFLFGYGVKNMDPKLKPYLPVIRDLYRAEVTFVDWCIGKLLDAMDRMKLWDDTILIFTTDHGTHLGEGGYVQKHPELLNWLVMQLPLLIRHPDQSHAGRHIWEPVSAVDLAPTICHLMGITDQEHMDGKNMWDLVTGKVDKLHDYVFTQFHNFASVRNKHWHYFQHISGNNRGAGPCLYNLDKDPLQTTNVIKDHPEVAKQMRALLADRLQQQLPPIDEV